MIAPYQLISILRPFMKESHLYGENIRVISKKFLMTCVSSLYELFGSDACREECF